MTTTQWVFVVFFAIFWGTVASVQGRWKLFHWPLIRYPHVAARLVLSVIVLNVMPVLFFTLIFFLLRRTPTSHTAEWNLCETLQQILAGVAPAFAIFGFYRLWVAVVEFSPTTFYQYEKDQSDLIKEVEPTIDFLGKNIYHEFWLWNLVFALIYILVAALIPWLLVS